MVLTDIAILFFYCLVLRWWHTQRFLLFDRYLNTYKKYQDLLNNKAETEINAFIQDEPVLLALSKVPFFYLEFCIDIMKCEDMVYYSGTVSFLSSITPMSVVVGYT